MWRQRKWRDLLSGFAISNQALAALLDLLYAQDTLNRQVKHPGIFELFPHFFFGRVHDETFGGVKHQAGYLDEPPETAGRDALAEQFIHLAIIQKDDFIKSLFRHVFHSTRFRR